jgi:hypothetical protein
VIAQRRAGIAALDVAAPGLSATRCDGPQGAVLHRDEPVRRLKRRAVARQHLREFYPSPCRIRTVRMHAHGLGASGIGPLQQVQRRRGTGQVLLGEMEVARGGAQAAVPKQALDGMHIGTGFEQMGGERVA